MEVLDEELIITFNVKITRTTPTKHYFPKANKVAGDATPLLGGLESRPDICKIMMFQVLIDIFSECFV